MCVHTSVSVLAVLEKTTFGEAAKTGSALSLCPTLLSFLLWEARRGLLHKVGRGREQALALLSCPPHWVTRLHNTWHLVQIKSTGSETSDGLNLNSRGSLE